MHLGSQKLGEICGMSFGMSKLGNLGETSFGSFQLGKLGNELWINAISKLGKRALTQEIS